MPTPSCWPPLQPSAKAMGGRVLSAETAKPAGDAATATAAGPEAAATGAVSSVTATGDGWAQLKVGDLVLACYGGPADGWWGARILKIEGDAFTLAWVDETEALARRPRAQLALVHPRLI